MRLPISPPGRCVHGYGHESSLCSGALMAERANIGWRPGSESNRRTRLCRPLHDHSATWPPEEKNIAIVPARRTKNKTPDCPRFCRKTGAGNETRTRDPDLGKVVLYQLSYSRASRALYGMGRRWQLPIPRLRYRPIAQRRPCGGDIKEAGPDRQHCGEREEHFTDVEQAQTVQVLLV